MKKKTLLRMCMVLFVVSANSIFSMNEISYSGGNRGSVSFPKQKDVFPKGYLGKKIEKIKDALQNRDKNKPNPDPTEVDKLTEEAVPQCKFNLSAETFVQGDGSESVDTGGNVRSVVRVKPQHQNVLAYLWSGVSKKQLCACVLALCALYLHRYHRHQALFDAISKFFAWYVKR